MSTKHRERYTDIGGGGVGTTGPQGDPGPQGIQGPQGDPGNDGADGAIGPIGPQGDTGPQGPAGNDGADGAVGATGAQGAQGLPGNDGADGATGAQGPQGDPGPTGAAGTNGTDGAQGIQGIQGVQGMPGADGNDGADGAQGIQGLPGNDGAVGAQGAQGVKGDTGDTGPAGTTVHSGLSSLDSDDHPQYLIPHYISGGNATADNFFVDAGTNTWKDLPIQQLSSITNNSITPSVSDWTWTPGSAELICHRSGAYAYIATLTLQKVTANQLTRLEARIQKTLPNTAWANQRGSVNGVRLQTVNDRAVITMAGQSSTVVAGEMWRCQVRNTSGNGSNILVPGGGFTLSIFAVNNG